MGLCGGYFLFWWMVVECCCGGGSGRKNCATAVIAGTRWKCHDVLTAAISQMLPTWVCETKRMRLAIEVPSKAVEDNHASKKPGKHFIMQPLYLIFRHPISSCPCTHRFISVCITPRGIRLTNCHCSTEPFLLRCILE